jgi:hypothetical protein
MQFPHDQEPTMNRNKTLGCAGRLAALAGAATLLLGASTALAQQERLLACRMSQYLFDPTGDPNVPTNRIFSTLSLANFNAASSIRIQRIVFYDRDGKIVQNGNSVCDFSQANPLPAKAFEDSATFDFKRPLGPHQALNVSSTVLPCIPWLEVIPDDIRGVMTVFVYWSFVRGTGVPLNGMVVTSVQEIASTLQTSRDSLACEELWPN